MVKDAMESVCMHKFMARYLSRFFHDTCQEPLLQLVWIWKSWQDLANRHLRFPQNTHTHTTALSLHFTSKNCLSYAGKLLLFSDYSLAPSIYHRNL